VGYFWPSLTTELLQMRQVNFAYASVDTVGGTAIDAADFFVGRLRFGKGGCDLLCPFAIARDLFLGSIDLGLDLGGGGIPLVGAVPRTAARAALSARPRGGGHADRRQRHAAPPPRHRSMRCWDQLTARALPRQSRQLSSGRPRPAGSTVANRRRQFCHQPRGPH